MNLFGIGRWLEWIGVRAARTKSAEQHAIDAFQHALDMGAAMIEIARALTERIANVETLLRQQKERQEEAMTRIDLIRAALAGLVAKDAERTEREHALIEAFGHVKAEVDDLKAKLSGVDPALDAQLADLSSALDAETAKAAAATAEVDAALAPAEETTVDASPAIEPAPEASAPAEAPVAPTEG
jgi:chromosome segregation ATPase